MHLSTVNVTSLYFSSNFPSRAFPIGGANVSLMASFPLWFMVKPPSCFITFFPAANQLRTFFLPPPHDDLSPAYTQDPLVSPPAISTQFRPFFVPQPDHPTVVPPLVRRFRRNANYPAFALEPFLPSLSRHRPVLLSLFDPLRAVRHCPRRVFL